MASRDINDLVPAVKEMAERLLVRCEEEDLDILIYCTLRTNEEQAKLYRQSRSLAQIKRKAEELRDKWGRPDLADLLMDVGPQYGAKVTYAGPGQSMHNYGLAFDSVPMRNGKAVWGSRREADRELWLKYGELGVEVGLEWAGNWSRFIEFPHMQQIDAAWRDLIIQG
jgi:peptidoglycan L-alanyl-D-glutamate endopeptidase CwlK